MLVIGVLTLLLPLTEPVGVVVDVDGSVLPFTPAAFFAAFSASRFCFDADGAMSSFNRSMELMKNFNTCLLCHVHVIYASLIIEDQDMHTKVIYPT